MKKSEFDLLEARIERLDTVVLELKVTANSLFSPKDEEWNMILIPAEKIEKHLEKLRKKFYKELDKINNG